MSGIAGVHICLYGMVSCAFISSPPLLAPGGGDPLPLGRKHDPRSIWTQTHWFLRLSTMVTSLLHGDLGTSRLYVVIGNVSVLVVAGGALLIGAPPGSV